MTVYRSSEQLVKTLEMLFGRIHERDATVEQAISQARLVIRLRLTGPAAQVTLNGRKTPPQITYGNTALQPDLDIELAADDLHKILSDELSLKKALAAGQMKVRGPVWKAFVLEGIFRQGRAIYPQLIQEMGFV